jgi:Glycosyl hydrolase catalytic core
MRLFPRLLLALLTLALLAPAAAPAKSKLKPVTGKLTAKVGIADQKADVFGDLRFRGMKIRIARRSVAWDTMQYDWQVADVDQWLRAARAAGVTPLITFARSRIDSRRHLRPSAKQVRRAFVAFRKKWPWVTQFVASNESNHYGEPTGRRPKLAAQWYKAMRSACRTCKIAAATLLDYPNLVSWTRAFVKAAREQPRYWALHNYISANRFQTARTRQFLQATRGEVWITEVGGAVKRPKGQAKFAEGTGHAAKVTRFIFGDLARLSRRITRVYLYHWNAERGPTTWDSGLVASDGRARPALGVVQQVLKGVKIKPLRRTSRRR